MYIYILYIIFKYFFSFFSVNASDKVLYTVREREKNYTDDQNDPDVVQPYAAYSPPGNVQVKCCITTTNHIQKLGILVSVKICPNRSQSAPTNPRT